MPIDDSDGRPKIEAKTEKESRWSFEDYYKSKYDIETLKKIITSARPWYSDWKAEVE